MTSEADQQTPEAGSEANFETLLVLGGGGIKGLAHVGVLKALEEAAIRPDAVVGTSVGALVGTMVAGGLGWRELTEIARRLTRDDIVSVNRRSLWFGGIRVQSVFESERLKDWIDGILPAHHFGELMLPLRFNAASLVSGKEVWFGSGRREDVSLLEAVYASCALPVYFQPARIGNDLLVDGGILNALALDEAASWGAKRVIAVDVGSDVVPPDPGYFEHGIVAIHDRVLNMALARQRADCLDRHRQDSMVYVRPAIGHLKTFDFDRTQFFMEEGYRAANEALEKVAAA